MVLSENYLPTEFYSQFKIFHEIMSIKIREILLVASSYDAFILEEDGSLASRIINEYSGLNLSMPPRVTRTSSAGEALILLNERAFDLVITMPNLDDMDAFSLGIEVKKINPDLPVILLAHSTRIVQPIVDKKNISGIDKVFVWSGNTDLLLALVKNVEDRLNIENDTQKAQVRVLILVEDSPVYYSSFLPLIYKEIVQQTQAVLGSGLNEDHRLLKMRVRPKILLAENYEEAMIYYEKYRDYLFGIISDTRFPRNGQIVDDAGAVLLSQIKRDIPDLPMALLSSNPDNQKKAMQIPALFLDKNSPNLLAELHDFFMNHLGFGDFIFRLSDGTQIDRASNLKELEEKLAHLPEESLWYHARRNNFSNWLMGRSEINLASVFRRKRADEFKFTNDMREYLISNVHALRLWRHKGVVSQFNPLTFDAETMDFVKVGQGSLGGKARGLAFMSVLLHQNPQIHEKYAQIDIKIPKSLVICTDGFESFVAQNHLAHFAVGDYSDIRIRKAFLNAKMPEWLVKILEAYLIQVKYPLSVRSSSLLEDAQFQPYAGLYETYMIPNNDPQLPVRLQRLVTAIKLVYASTYYEGPRAFAQNTSKQPQKESMAVIIQQLAGNEYGDYFYPAVSGVAQSQNFYPISPMKAEEGIVHIALGLGKAVVEGEQTLRFSPEYPEILPQFSTVEDMLANSQRSFYSLKIRDYPETLNFQKYSNLEKLSVDEAETDFPVKTLASTYIPDEHRVRDSGHIPGPKIMTFASILKYDLLPLPQLLTTLLTLGHKGIGCPVEIEFSVNLNQNNRPKDEFYFLQMRPMAPDEARLEVEITRDDIQKAICRSARALGNGLNNSIKDIIFVKPEDFKSGATVQIAGEIGKINASLVKEQRPYLLVGPGRWGSADRWLGIPVKWQNISGVSAIIELRNAAIRAEPSQGSHFFQNITSLGIHYITVTEDSDDFFDWQWIKGLNPNRETKFLRHVRLENPLLLKIDGRKSDCVIIGT
ncbi:MAG: phosphoenolpyruvate synthase/pyruvate phosphate dikinase [Deltaproteobacteria bacterium]|nr:phosphoenolpyruvate synthase/pyruvate phosphate dikinase [Deltaproteobacteria bacterium]